jgi:hypothetical protein
MAPHLVNRLRASGVHLLISLCIAALSAALVFLVWYPTPLAAASGVTGIFLLLLVVDISLGPLITLFIFNLKKPELKRDLAIVGVIQLAALLYGLHAVYVARPAYVVFAADRFDLVFANDLDEKKLAAATLPQFRQVPMFGPQIIAAPLPTNPAERQALLFATVNGGEDLYQQPKFYRPYADARGTVQQRAQPLARLKDFNKDQLVRVDQLIAKYQAGKRDAGFLPLKGKAQDTAVIVDRASGDVLEMVSLRPWL